MTTIEQALTTIEQALKRAEEIEDSQIQNLIQETSKLMERTARKKESDKCTDAKRRRLIGARMPRIDAERCRACAALMGISQYRFTVNALERECRMVEAAHRMVWQDNHHVTRTDADRCGQRGTEE